MWTITWNRKCSFSDYDWEPSMIDFIITHIPLWNYLSEEKKILREKSRMRFKIIWQKTFALSILIRRVYNSILKMNGHNLKTKLSHLYRSRPWRCHYFFSYNESQFQVLLRLFYFSSSFDVNFDAYAIWIMFDGIHYIL